MSFLVDIGGLSPCSCNTALEGLYKAIGEDHDIWAPHENLYIRDLVEWFTQRGLVRHDKLQAELSNWLVGRYYLPGLMLPRPAHAAWEPWTAGELEAVRVYLQTMHDFSLEDSALLVDYLIQKYLPASTEEGEHLVVKANLLGRVQAHGVPEAMVARIAVALPGTVADALRMFTYPQASKTILQYGWLHAGENIVAMGDSLRHQIKNTVLKHMAERIAGARPDEGKLQQELFDKFAVANRDWRRIALTEAGEMANQGFVASLPAGIMVRRMEQYYGACAWCKKIDGHLFRVTTPDDPNKDGDKDIWVGKTNIGRSSSPYKKTDEGLVPRTASELYWVAAGTQHPHCFIDPRVPVYTSEGWQPIADIRVGDQVLTHQGRFRAVNWVLSGRRHTGEVVKLRTGPKNSQWTPWMTPEHPVLTERGWVSAGDIVAGEKVIYLGKTCPTCGNVFANARHAMNHDHDYAFASLSVDAIARREVVGKSLFNFGVEDDESYIVSRGLVVHNCRGVWIRMSPPQPGDDPEFGAWLRQRLGQKVGL